MLKNTGKDNSPAVIMTSPPLWVDLGP